MITTILLRQKQTYVQLLNKTTAGMIDSSNSLHVAFHMASNLDLEGNLSDCFIFSTNRAEAVKWDWAQRGLWEMKSLFCEH